MTTPSTSSAALAAAITKSASKQTYYTVRFLVDRELIPDAYRAYAYFRWVDDHLDQELSDESDRLAFIARQRALVEACLWGEPPAEATPEEQMLVDLVRNERADSRGLRIYIREMLGVMAFDAGRRGRTISQAELDGYVRSLATAVTEALHYFIGHCCPTPQSEARYLAASGAHVVHMLRDAVDDNQAGYFNIPSEQLKAQALDPGQVESRAYRAWVRTRVRLARKYFAAGKAYLARVENFRCRLAGYAYIARFEGVLEAIEREGYLLRADYRAQKSAGSAANMLWSAFRSAAWPPEPKARVPRPGRPIPRRAGN